jgi:hypothetical protein
VHSIVAFADKTCDIEGMVKTVTFNRGSFKRHMFLLHEARSDGPHYDLLIPRKGFDLQVYYSTMRSLFKSMI